VNKELWLVSDETRQFIKEINKAIEKCKEDLSSGTTMLNSSEEMLKDYIYNIGVIDGLKYLKQYVENKDEQSEAIFGQDEDRSLI
jgi:hypothetical protein